jgi:hypothetical protein
VIGSLPATVIRIVFFFFFLFFFSLYCWFPFLYFCFSLVVACISFYSFISLYVFIHVSPCNKALSFLFDLPVFALVQTLGYRCERFPGFQVEEDEFRQDDFALKAKE